MIPEKAENPHQRVGIKRNKFMALVTTGLTNNGLTTHYQIQYDDSLSTADGVDRANGLIGVCESDYNIMSNWFGGIALTVGTPITVNIVPGSYASAGWGPPITLKPGNGSDLTLVRYLLVSEVTEMFMLAQNRGWFAPDGSNEGSAGEGLSRFLATQFLQAIGSGLVGEPGFDLANSWLNSTREDFVNHIDTGDHGIDAKTGCSILFIYYLFTQLGFSINAIINAAASELSGVYNNLTGDNGNPFPFFKLLLDNGFPGTSTINSGNLDNPFPQGMLSFWVDKNTFSKDEVQDVINIHGGKFNNAFWLVVEGFNVNTFNSFNVTIPNLTGTFTNITGITVSRSATPIDFENTLNPNVPQRIRIAYDITFTHDSLAAFPTVGDAPSIFELDAGITINGNTPPNATANTIFELTAGADPYFTNIDPSQNNVFWLSQDLRVFTATPGKNNIPVAGGPVFGSDNINGAFSYVQNLLNYLNTSFGDPSGTDPFVSLLPGQTGALTGDSSVAPVTVDFSNIFNIHIYNNYNFAIARVRLRGLPGDAANNVKVFFRLWSTQTADTDFQSSSTYLSNVDVQNHPISPLVGTGNHTIPFFATGNFPGNSDYVNGGINNKTITLDAGDYKWVYFGCFLNLYDSGNIINGQQIQTLLNGTHHCLVAEIAYNDAPILNSSAVVLSPENSDKLAQRNLQLTTSDNPGEAASHRIPQTFDIRPSMPLLQQEGSLLNYPDELMIDWGNTPADSMASIYWPQVNATDVLTLATQLYGTHLLTAADANTIQCKVTMGVSYIPIPIGTGENLASLLTIDLPTTVVKGQEFNIIVRRITTRRNQGVILKSFRNANAVFQAKTESHRPGEYDNPQEGDDNGAFNRNKFKNWRYVMGTFQVKIPVATAETMLAPEQSTLAIMKWRLLQMSPASRWYPVLQRYILYLTARVNGLGGNADNVKPSPMGYWELPQKEGEERCEYSGKICKVMFDCCGEFDGFVLKDCGKEHLFKSNEPMIGELAIRACKERLKVAVCVDKNSKDRICKLVIEC